MSLPPRPLNGSPGEIGGLRKRRFKVEEADERESQMIDISNYKVYSGPFTTEERDYLLQLGYLQLGQDGEYHEIETESDSDEDDHHNDAIAKELKKSDQLLRSFAQVNGFAKNKGDGPVSLNPNKRSQIRDGKRDENANSLSTHDQRTSGKKIGFLGLKKKTGILVRALRKKYHR